MNSDIETLIRATTYGEQWDGINGVADALVGKLTESMSAEVAASVSSAQEGPAEIAVQIKRFVDAATATQASNGAPLKADSASGATQESSPAETAARTAAMMTDVGPLVTGLIQLFGSSEPEMLPALEKFSAPSVISVEAGLTQDREFSALRYAQGGTPEALRGASGISSQSPTIQVNIQAMDSQSFLDRQDDIARAVREAMLHSNSINDVVLEL